MDSFNYDSYCGIYCGACDIMMTYKTGCQHRLASFWNESTVKTFHNKLGITYDPNKPFTVKCNGCKTDTLFVNCAVCQIRRSAINNKIEHCIDCNKYPCNLIVGANKVKSLLPHIKNNRINMETIKKVGVTQWLSEQEKRWKCPNCKTNFSWYTRKCMNCGEDLREYTFTFSFLQSMILKLGIYSLSRKQKQ